MLVNQDLSGSWFGSVFDSEKRITDKEAADVFKYATGRDAPKRAEKPGVGYAIKKKSYEVKRDVGDFVGGFAKGARALIVKIVIVAVVGLFLFFLVKSLAGGVAAKVV